MGADLTYELDDMELIAGDGRIIELAEVADLGDDAAELVVLLDSLAHSLIGDINAKTVLHLVNDLELKLSFVVIKVGLIALHGRIDLGNEKSVVLNGIDEEEVLFHTLHGRAAFRAEQAAEVVVSAFDGALENGACIGAGTVCHVVVCNIAGRAIGSAKS